MTPLKEVYNKNFFNALVSALKKSYQKFDQNKFLTLVLDKDWKDRELKQRMRHISACLNKTLTNSYSQNIQILKDTAQNIELNDRLKGLSLVIFADYVEAFGLDDFEVSISALEYFTEYGSSEFAIRHFIEKYEKQTLKIMHDWSKNSNHHLRRLASEGSRSRLPWGIALQKFKKDPKPIISILENLLDDESEYVRKSVANNLNDISKDNPQIALQLAKSWLNSQNHRQKIVRHGLRGLLKNGNKEALALFGINESKNVTIESFDLQKSLIRMGGDLNFTFKLINQKKNKVRLEYAIYFLMANNSYSKKIFQITQKEFEKGEFLLKKKHSFKKISTRKFYPGKHFLALIINGKEVVKKEFELLKIC